MGQDQLINEIDRYFLSKESANPTILEKIWTVVKSTISDEQWVACAKFNANWFVGYDQEWLVDLSRARRGSRAEMEALGRQLRARGFPVENFRLQRLPT